MDLVILPPIAEVAFVVVETDQAPLHEQPKPARRQVVVFMDFGQAIREIKSLVVDGVVERHLHPFLVWEDLGHGGADKRIHAVVVANVQKATCVEVAAKLVRLARGKHDVSVARHVDPRVVEEVWRPHVDVGHVFRQVHPHFFVAVTHQVGHRRRVGIPVASATVLQHGQLDVGHGLGLERCVWKTHHSKNHHPTCPKVRQNCNLFHDTKVCFPPKPPRPFAQRALLFFLYSRT